MEKNGNTLNEENKKEVWLTPKDVEERTKLSHGTVNKMFHLKGFPVIRIGRTLRVREEDFKKFIDSYANHTINI